MASRRDWVKRTFDDEGDRAFLRAMRITTRRRLQDIAIARGIKANQKSTTIVTNLRKLQQPFVVANTTVTTTTPQRTSRPKPTVMPVVADNTSAATATMPLMLGYLDGRDQGSLVATARSGRAMVSDWNRKIGWMPRRSAFSKPLAGCIYDFLGVRILDVRSLSPDTGMLAAMKTRALFKVQFMHPIRGTVVQTFCSGSGTNSTHFYPISGAETWENDTYRLIKHPHYKEKYEYDPVLGLISNAFTRVPDPEGLTKRLLDANLGLHANCLRAMDTWYEANKRRTLLGRVVSDDRSGANTWVRYGRNAPHVRIPRFRRGLNAGGVNDWIGTAQVLWWDAGNHAGGIRLSVDRSSVLWIRLPGQESGTYHRVASDLVAQRLRMVIRRITSSNATALITWAVKKAHEIARRMNARSLNSDESDGLSVTQIKAIRASIRSSENRIPMSLDERIRRLVSTIEFAEDGTVVRMTKRRL